MYLYLIILSSEDDGNMTQHDSFIQSILTQENWTQSNPNIFIKILYS